MKNNESERLIQFLKVIGDENRLNIFRFLLTSEQCVCDIWRDLELPQNLVSHHLKVLRDFGLVNARKEGLKVYYCVNKQTVGEYTVLFSNLLEVSHGK